MSGARLGRAAAILLAALALAACSRAGDRLRYVDAARGDDAADGASSGSAWRSLAVAVRHLAPGDTLLVAPGVYRGGVALACRGTAGQPIRLLAADGGAGSVIVSQADPGIRAGATWTGVGDGVFSTPCPAGLPARVLANGYDAFPYASLAALRSGRIRPEVPGPRLGYAWESGILYLHPHPDGRYGPPDPARLTIAVAPPTGGQFDGTWITDPGQYGLAVTGGGAAHVVIDGFVFETPGVAGVHVAADAVTVRRCTFRGCRTGVAGNYSDRLPDPACMNYMDYRLDPAASASAAADITIEWCDFAQDPVFAEVEEVLGGWKPSGPAAGFAAIWARKDRYSGAIADNRLKYEMGIAARIGHRWTIRRNAIHDCFEGLSCHGTSASVGLRVAENRFERICDNAVEAEDHARDLRIERNEVVDVFEPFSWQPLRGLPWPESVLIRGNLVATTARYRHLWDPVTRQRGVLKVGAKLENWDSLPRLMEAVPRSPIVLAGQGLRVVHNTVLDHPGRVITPQGDPRTPMHGVVIAGNIIAATCLESADPRKDLASGVFAFSGNLAAPSLPGSAGPSGVIAARGGLLVADQEAFRLDGRGVPRADSPAHALRDAEGIAGALQPGDAWSPLAVGPAAAPDR